MAKKQRKKKKKKKKSKKEKSKILSKEEEGVGDGRVVGVVNKLKRLMGEAKDPTRISRRAFELLERLKSIQSSLPCSMGTSTKEQNEKLMEWYEERMGVKRFVEMRESPGQGNGVFAKKRIEKHDLLFEVPYDMIMMESSAKKQLKLFIELCPSIGNMSSVLMALYVLAERLAGKKSKFHSYISTLPTMFTIPICYESIKEFEYLRGTPIQMGAVSVFRVTVQQYCRLYEVIAHATTNYSESTPIRVDDFTWENWRWAVSIVMTRQNKVPVKVSSKSDDDKVDGGVEEENIVQSLALIPLFDAINHESGGNITTDGNPKESILKCYAMREFKNNEQIKMFYGNRTDAEFVLYSGFLPNRPNGVKLCLDVGLDPKDPLLKLKQMFLEKVIPVSSRTSHGLAVEIQFDTALKPKHGMQKLFSIVRIVVANKSELEQLIRSKEQIGAQILSSENEIRTYSCLKTLCSNRLNMYPKYDGVQQKIDDLLCMDIKKLRKRVALMARKRDRSMLLSLKSYVNERMKAAVEEELKSTK